MTIREAELHDIPQLVRMGEQFATSVYGLLLTWNAAQCGRFAEMLIGSETGLVLIAEDSGAAIGMIGAMIYPHPLSAELIASELFWWVEPLARGSVGMRLLRRFRAWAQSKGAAVLQLIAPNERVAAFYEHAGFARTEITYQRRLA